jgi:hypothetical protein
VVPAHGDDCLPGDGIHAKRDGRPTGAGSIPVVSVLFFFFVFGGTTPLVGQLHELVKIHQDGCLSVELVCKAVYVAVLYSFWSGMPSAFVLFH